MKSPDVFPFLEKILETASNVAEGSECSSDAKVMLRYIGAKIRALQLQMENDLQALEIKRLRQYATSLEDTLEDTAGGIPDVSPSVSGGSLVMPVCTCKMHDGPHFHTDPHTVIPVDAMRRGIAGFSIEGRAPPETVDTLSEALREKAAQVLGVEPSELVVVREPRKVLCRHEDIVVNQVGQRSCEACGGIWKLPEKEKRAPIAMGSIGLGEWKQVKEPRTSLCTHDGRCTILPSGCWQCDGCGGIWEPLPVDVSKLKVITDPANADCKHEGLGRIAGGMRSCMLCSGIWKDPESNTPSAIADDLDDQEEQ